MGVAGEEAVVVKRDGEEGVITVNCKDEIGLGCDLCWIILESGLRITRGDVSTDGKWCYVILWVVPRSASMKVSWSNLKNRLLARCPSFSVAAYLNLSTPPVAESPLYLLKLLCVDQKGLLHDVTHNLWEIGLLIHRVKVSTTPDGRVVDLFFVTDAMGRMFDKARQEETCSRLRSILGKTCQMCEMQLAGPECENFRKGRSTISDEKAEKLLTLDIPNSELRSQTLSPDLTKIKNVSITVDNTLSSAHTLLKIRCADQKSLLYDILRTLKDCNILVTYNRCLSDMKGSREMDLFLQQSDGKKIMDPEKQEALCSRLRMEMFHPLRVLVINRGPDTELLVANPVELSGKGRPHVFYDVSLALKTLGICVFLAEIGRYSTAERQWEVYRFLLDENRHFPLADERARHRIVDEVRKILMGW